MPAWRGTALALRVAMSQNGRPGNQPWPPSPSRVIPPDRLGRNFGRVKAFGHPFHPVLPFWDCNLRVRRWARNCQFPSRGVWPIMRFGWSSGQNGRSAWENCCAEWASGGLRLTFAAASFPYWCWPWAYGPSAPGWPGKARNRRRHCCGREFRRCERRGRELGRL